MDKFLADTFAWLYSLNGSAVNLAGCALLCYGLDGRWYPVHLRTLVIALAWPVVFVFAMPFLLVLGALKGFDLVSSYFNKLDQEKGAPLRILDAINPRRWRSRAAARGSEAPSP